MPFLLRSPAGAAFPVVLLPLAASRLRRHLISTALMLKRLLRHRTSRMAGAQAAPEAGDYLLAGYSPGDCRRDICWSGILLGRSLGQGSERTQAAFLMYRYVRFSARRT
jgi:hypothetical protein